MIDAILIVLMPWAIGGALLELLGVGDEDDRLGRFGWDVATGCLALALLLFLQGVVQPGTVDLYPTTLVLGLLFLPYAVWRHHRTWTRAEHGKPPAAPHTPRVLRIALVLALGFALLRAVDGTLIPALAGDEAMLWGYRARVIASEGGLGRGFVEAMGAPGLRHEDYPLAPSLLQAWVLDVFGQGGTVHLRLPAQLIALALVASLAAALRRHARPLVAAALLLGFVALPHTRGALQSGGAEGAVALGLVVAVDAWLRWRAEGGSRWLALGSIGLALALFSKNDAALFVLALAGGIVLARLATPPDQRQLRPRRSLRWALLPLAVVVLGAAYNAWAGFENDLVTGKGQGAGPLERLVTQPLSTEPVVGDSYLATTAEFFADDLLLHPRFDGLVLLLSLVLLVRLLARQRRGLVTAHAAALGLSAAVAASLVGLFLVYLTTPQPLLWHLWSSANRVTWQVIPLACLALACAFPRSDP